MRLETAMRRQLRIWFQSFLFPWPEYIAFYRHGKSLGNQQIEEIKKGLRTTYSDDIKNMRNMEIPLCQLGEQQADITGEWTEKSGLVFDRILVSPYTRAVQTAERIFPGRTDFEIDFRLEEKEFGLFDALSDDERCILFPEWVKNKKRMDKFYATLPGGQNYRSMLWESKSFLSMVIREYSGERIAVVSHSAKIEAFRMALEHLTEANLIDYAKTRPIANASVLIYQERKTSEGKSKVYPFTPKPIVPWRGILKDE